MAANPYPNLPYDPCPGDLDGYQTLKDYAGKSARYVEEAAKVLAMAQSPEWVGKTADAFRDHLHADVLPLVDTAASSIGKAAAALSAWYTTLQGLQHQAARLNQLAAPYAAELAAANRSLPFSAQVTTGKPAFELALPLPTLTAAQKTAKSNAEAAAGSLNGIYRQVNNLHQEYLAAVSRCAGQLDAAGNMAPKPPGFWDDIGHWFEHTWDDTIEDPKFWRFLSEVANVVSTVAAILALFPPLTAIFGPIALIAAEVGLVADTVLYVFFGGSLSAVLLDLTAVIGGKVADAAADGLLGVYKAGVESGEIAEAADGLKSSPTIAGLLSKSKIILKLPVVGNAIEGANHTAPAVPGVLDWISMSLKGDNTVDVLNGLKDTKLLLKANIWRGVDITVGELNWVPTAIGGSGTYDIIKGWFDGHAVSE